MSNTLNSEAPGASVVDVPSGDEYPPGTISDNTHALQSRSATREAPEESVDDVPSGDEPALGESVGITVHDNVGALPSGEAPGASAVAIPSGDEYPLGLGSNESTTEMEIDPPASSNPVDGELLAATSVLRDAWWKEHQRWFIGGFVFIFVAVAAILGVTLSSQNGSGDVVVGGQQSEQAPTTNPAIPTHTLAIPSPPPTSPPIETLPSVSLL